jgi:CRP-like cAMP-binding protein
LPTSAWKKIVAHAETVQLAPGQNIVKAGERDHAFYILSAGAVEVVIPGPDGEHVLASIPEGSVFGEISFFDGEPRSATIRATTPGTALRITRDGFDSLSGWDPALARLMLIDLGRVLALRLRWTTQLEHSELQP